MLGFFTGGSVFSKFSEPEFVVFFILFWANNYWKLIHPFLHHECDGIRIAHPSEDGSVGYLIAVSFHFDLVIKNCPYMTLKI